MTKELLRVGVVGYGLVSQKWHCPIISRINNLVITHIVERKGETSKEKYPSVEVVKSLDKLVLNPEVDLIVLTTPSGVHYDNVKTCLNAGKHVVCEKPFTVYHKDSMELCRIAKEKNLMLSVFHNRRWDSDFLTLNRVLNTKVLGHVYEFEANWYMYRPIPKAGNPWREQKIPGSGNLYDLGSHLIDQAIQVFGVPTHVCGDVRCQRDENIADDYFCVTLHYSHNPKLVVRLKASALAKINGPRYVIHGSKGSCVKHGMCVQEAQLRAPLSENAKLPGDIGYGVDVDPANRPFLDVAEFESEEAEHRIKSLLGYNDDGTINVLDGCYQEYYEKVAECITSMDYSNPPVTALDGAHVVNVIEAALRSAKNDSVKTELGLV